MSLEHNPSQDFNSTFERLADLVNRLPEEERVKLRACLGEYTHDLKHTLGVVIGANAILARLVPQTEADSSTMLEMTGMIDKAALQLDGLVMLLVEGLNNQIEIE